MAKKLLLKLFPYSGPKIIRELEVKDHIYVVGNSHTRAFSFNRNFFPLFIGPGKTHCLISDESLELLKNSFRKALETIGNAKVMLVLGEPDARYYLGKGWYPWEGNRQMSIRDFRPYIDQSFARYAQLVEYLKQNFDNQYLVLNVMPVEDAHQNEIINYFNMLLSNYCEKESIFFVDVNEKLYLTDVQISPEFLGDQIHLNNRIQPIIEECLISNGFLEKSHYEGKVDWDHEKIKNLYEYNEKFGCYVLK